MSYTVAAASALLAFLSAASPALARQDLPPPVDKERASKHDLLSSVEVSYLMPVNHRVLDPVGLARFQLSLESLLHGTLDDSVKGSPLLMKGGFFFGVLMLDRTIAKMGHEYGHIAVFNRAGYHDFLLSVGRQDPEALSFREVLINSLVPQRHIAVQLEEADAVDAANRFSGRDFDEFTALTYAGGLNQEQVHLNLYRERVLRHEFGFFDTAPYLIESISTLAYSGSENADLDGYVDSLAEAGYTTSIARAKAMSLVRFFSGSAVSAGTGFYRAMFHDAFDGFAPRVIGKGKDWTVLWPEFESFLTRRGPTARMSVPVRAGGFLVVPGLEAAVVEEGWEFEVGVEASRPALPWLDVRAGIFAGTDGGSWGEAGVALKPDPSISLLLSWHFANGYTFRRDVYGETFDFESKVERGLQFGASMRFRF